MPSDPDARPYARLSARRLSRRTFLQGWMAATVVAVVACGTTRGQPAPVEATADHPTTTLAATATLAPLEDAVAYDSLRMFSTLDEAVFAAELVVIGDLIKIGPVINSSRDMRDKTNPKAHPTIAGVGQVYQVRVQRYLKGSGPATLDVIQGEGSYPVARAGEPQIVERSRARYRDVHLVPATPYLFLLKTIDLPPEGSFYGNNTTPWRFTVPAGGTAGVATRSNAVIAERFPPRPTAAFLAEVEMLAKLPPGSPPRTATPVPPTQPLRPIGKIPPTATTAPSTRPPASPSVATPGTSVPSAAGTPTLTPGPQPTRP